MKRVCIVIILAPLASVAYGDVIYDGQTYNYDETTGIRSISGADGIETADDFEVGGYWTLELVRVWFGYGGEQADIRVDIFSNGPGDEPGTPPPGDLYYEEVPSGNMTWTDTGDTIAGNPIYQVDIPIEGFYIEPTTRYWLGLQIISGDNSGWLSMNDTNPLAWWETINSYYSGSWHEWHGPFQTEFFGCEFELHGTPVDTGVSPESLGVIKAGYR